MTKRKDPSRSLRNLWSADEDAVLHAIAARNGGRIGLGVKVMLAAALPDRNLEACRARWDTLTKGGAHCPHPTPEKPKGMTTEQIQWARQNPLTLEGRMILGFAQEGLL